jgi:hypothetical protein
VKKQSKDAFGFLTVVEDDRHGLFGGYLVLNEAGRPLEFHCTAPIRPSRPQEILYGNTLRPYLYGEQIGQALLSKAKHPPSIILTDQRPALALQTLIEIPVTLILPTKNEEPATIALESDPYEILGPPLADSPENENLNRQMDPGTAGAVVAQLDRGATPDRDTAGQARDEWEIEPASDGSERLTAFRLGINHLAVPYTAKHLRTEVTQHLARMAEMLDLSEPFSRIQEAISEARRGG